MNRLGQVCLGLTLVSLAAGIYLGGRLGNYANSWSTRLRDARTASEKAIADNSKALLDLRTAQAELDRVKIGWGHEWEFLPTENVGGIQVVGQNLAVTGLGQDDPGMRVRQVTVDGREEILAPSIHVFALNGQGGSVYIGEFLADRTQLAPNNSTLIPTWQVTPPEIAAWNFSNGVRLRTLVPPGERTGVEGLHQAVRRTRELFAETQAAINSQKLLLEAAQQQLATRKAELLGDPNAKPIADRPEFTAGLVQALEDLEEERNATQLAVDRLRRGILEASNTRTTLLEELKQTAEKLPTPQPQITRREQ